jgi:hypothetical protein
MRGTRNDKKCCGNAVEKETDNSVLCTTIFNFLYACIIIDRNNQVSFSMYAILVFWYFTNDAKI